MIKNKLFAEINGIHVSTLIKGIDQSAKICEFSPKLASLNFLRYGAESSDRKNEH